MKLWDEGKIGTTAKPKPMLSGAPSDFQTDPRALDCLFPYIPKGWAVWECAAGKRQLTNAFLDRGHIVYSTDILTGEDFLISEPEGPYDFICTNPPFHAKDAFLRRAVELNKPFALLVRDSIFDSRPRRKILAPIASEIGIVFPDNRIKFTTPNIKKIGGAWFYTYFLCRGLNLPCPFVFPDE